jgi:basic membrane protein A
MWRAFRLDSEQKYGGKTLHILYLVAMLVIVTLSIVLILTTSAQGNAPLKVGCVFSGSVTETGWNSANYAGISEACASGTTELMIRENIPEEEMPCISAVDSLVAENCSMIFLTSYGYERFTEKLMISYPNVKFCVTGSENADDRLIYYFGRMYEGRYLAGLIAGLTTKSNVVGYVAAMPNNEVNRGINAFALGVRKMNPEARVKVIFTGAWDDAEKEKAAVQKLADMSADVMAYHQNRENVPQMCDELGIDFIGTYKLSGEYSDHCLTCVDCRWDNIYGSIIRDYQNRRVEHGGIYWTGYSDGAVMLTGFSERVSVRARYEVSFAEERLDAGMNVFSGEIYDNTGVLRCSVGESLGDNSLIYGMDWYLEGVEIV